MESFLKSRVIISYEFDHKTDIAKGATIDIDTTSAIAILMATQFPSIHNCDDEKDVQYRTQQMLLACRDILRSFSYRALGTAAPREDELRNFADMLQEEETQKR
jgi:hypothetical protein